MIEAMIETLMAEVGIDETKLLQYIEIGLQSSHHKKVFEQLLIVDNFLVFKKLMVKRNKELELEALKEMMQNEEQPAEQDEEKLKIATMEAERAEIEHAIQMSMAADEEIKKLQENEDEELRKVLEMSKITFQKEQTSRIEAQKQEDTPKPDQNQIVDYAITTKVEHAPVQKKEESPVKQQEKIVSPAKQSQEKPKVVQQQQKEVEVEEQKQQIKEFKPLPALKPISALPPLVNKKYEKPIDDLLADRAQLLQQLDTYKQVEEKLRNQQVPEKQPQEDNPNKEESLEDRKQRLLAQRELLRKKKQQQREEELKNYKETGDEGKKSISSQQSVLLSENSTSNEKLSAEELQKRQNLMSKIKQNM